MLLLSPRKVTFGTLTMENAASVAFDRSATKTVVEWSDLGPHIVFADVPEQRINVAVTHQTERDTPDAPKPGDQGTLTIFTSPAGTDGGRKKITATAIVTGIRHELSLRRAPTRVVEFVLVSVNGVADPIVIEDV